MCMPGAPGGWTRETYPLEQDGFDGCEPPCGASHMDILKLWKGLNDDFLF